MPRLFHFLILICLGTVLLRGDGADDAYIRIYNVLQQADAHRESGRLTEARDAYAEARNGLLSLQQNFPAWNDRVVNYRLRYVSEKLQSLKNQHEQAPSAPKNLGSTNVAPAPASVAPDGEVLAQFERFNVQIRQLDGDKKLLEAKLREALTSQPAPVDPREFQSAIERITALQSTNKLLIQKLESQQSERQGLVDKVLVEEAKQALGEANRKLLTQQASSKRLEKERQEIEARLKRLQDGAVKSLQTENSALKQQVGELKTDTDRGRQVADLAGKMSRLQTDLESIRVKNGQLAAEKSALERQVDDFKARSSEEGIVKIRKLETDLAAARLTANRNTAQAELIAVSLIQEKKARGDLELANRSLQSRVDDLTQGITRDAVAMKSLQSTLAAERSERDSLQRELKTTEVRLAQMGRGTNTTAVNSASTAGDLAHARGEVTRLRTALKEGAEREAQLRTTLRQSEDWRVRFLSEKSDLEKRLAASLAAPVRPIATIPVPDRQTAPAPAPTATAKALARLESKVQDLEKERSLLQKRVEELTRASQSGLAVNRGWRVLTPRQHIEEFNRIHR
ncbi:MAG: hypothetical protein EXS25_05840 [Pedosphaera sp.]|nr:hypothetical protein [Pedosphaera sp.]